MPWQSKLPLVIAALDTMWTAALVSSKTTVIRGPKVANGSLREVLSIGYQDETEGTHSGNVIRAFEGLAANSQREQLSVNCSVSVLHGTDIGAAMDRAYAILSIAGAALTADVSLGRLVLLARMGSEDLILKTGRQGQTALIPFTVDCDAFTGR